MSNIQNKYQHSVEQAVRDHFVGNRSGERKDWHWCLHPDRDSDRIIKKLQLVLSWVFGRKVLSMTPRELMFHTLEEYKKCNKDTYLTMKYII